MSDDDRKMSPDRRKGRSRSRSRSPVRRSRIRTKRIVIANVPYDTNWQKIKELVREKIGYTGFFEMCEKDGKSMGMGVMEFKTYEGAEKAIEAMHRYPMGDRKLVVREETSKDRDRMEQFKTGIDKQAAQQAAMNLITPQVLAQLCIEGPISNQIYITNLAYNVTWQKLKDVFKMAGNVKNVEMKVNKDGSPKGQAVLRFEFPFEAVQAISMFNCQVLFERPMRLRMDKEVAPNQIQAPSSQSRLPEGLQSVGMGLGMQGQAVRSLQDLAQLTGGMGGGGGGGGGGGFGAPGGRMSGSFNEPAMFGRSLDGGLDRHGGIDDRGMRDLGGDNYLGAGMRDLGNDNYLRGNNYGRSRLDDTYSRGMGNGSGYGRGGNHGHGSNNDLMNMNVGSHMTTAYPDVALGGGGGGGVGGGMGGRPSSDTVVVKNLPYSYTWQDLKRSFRDVGEVRYAEIRTDANNRSMGVGIVRYINPDDAKRAVTMMDGSRFDGRAVRVELD